MKANKLARFLHEHTQIILLTSCLLFLTGLITADLWFIAVGASALLCCLAISPGRRLFKAYHNREKKRKKLKGMVTVSSWLAGALLGCLLLAKSVPLLFLIHQSMYLLAFGPAIWVGIVCLNALRSYKFNDSIKYNLLSVVAFCSIAFALAFTVGLPLISPSIHLMICSAILGGYVLSMAAKQVMRLYYKSIRGDSNEDGLHYMQGSSAEIASALSGSRRKRITAEQVEQKQRLLLSEIQAEGKNWCLSALPKAKSAKRHLKDTLDVLYRPDDYDVDIRDQLCNEIHYQPANFSFGKG